MPLYPSTLSPWAVILIFCLTIKAKPQDPSIFEDMAKSGLMVMGNMAEIVSNNALITKNVDFDMPFAKAKSDTELGAGGAMRNNADYEDDSSEEIRRKRAVDLDTNAPCHMGTGGGGGNGMDDVDVEEARRRMYNRLRQAAKRAKRARQTRNKTKKKFSSNDGNEEMEQPLTRRKRQTEVDDLNDSMTNAGNDFSQKAQQFAEKVRNIFEGFMKSMHEMAETLKQQFSGGQTATPPATTNNEEV